MKKILYLMSFLLCFCLLSLKVSASNFTNGYINDLYYKIIHNGNVTIKKTNYIKDKITDEKAFSLDPLIDVDENSIYDEYLPKDKELFNLNEDLFNQINAIIFYGYSNNIKNEMNYIVTQLLVWRAVNPDYEIYLSDDEGTLIATYDKKARTITREANAYIPITTAHKIDVGYSRPVLIISKNEYESILSEGLQDDYHGRILLSEYKSGTNTYNIAQGYENNAKLYSNSNNSYLIKVYELPLIIHDYIIETKSNNININFNTIDDIYSNSTIESSYGIYNIYDELVKKIIINNKDKYTFNLDYGYYYIKQINNGIYKVDDNIYEFEINDSDTNITIDLEKITKEINISLEYCKYDTCTNDEAKFIITDGKKDIELSFNKSISINLGLGKYYLKQILTQDKYNLIDDILIDLESSNTNQLTFNLKSNIKTGNINVYLTDINGNNINNSKICLYSNNYDLIDCNYTNKGKVIFSNLIIDKYIIKQESTDSKYDINIIDSIIDLTEDNSSIYIINYLKEDNIKKDIINKSNEIVIDIPTNDSNNTLLNENNVDIPIENNKESNISQNSIILDTFDKESNINHDYELIAYNDEKNSEKEQINNNDYNEEVNKYKFIKNILIIVIVILLIIILILLKIIKNSSNK